MLLFCLPNVLFVLLMLSSSIPVLMMVAVLELARLWFLPRWTPRHRVLRLTAPWLPETMKSTTLVIMVMAFLIQPFIARAYVIPTASMENTLPVGTRILASPLAPRVVSIHANDVLVFHPPHLALEMSGGQDDEVWIKRCIGTPGQRIEIKKNVLWRDGKIVAEPHVIWKNPGFAPLVYDLKIVDEAVYSRSYSALGRAGFWKQAEVVAPDQNAISRAPSGVVPSEQFLMLGDHRNDSLDGHVWGFLARRQIVGRAFVSFWPPRQIGTINR